MRNMSRAAALGLAATAVGAVPAHAAVTAPSGGRAYERVTQQGTASPPQGALISDDGMQAMFRWGATLPQATNGFVSQNGYVSQRGAAGWLMTEAVPGPGGVRRPEFFAASPDGRRVVLHTMGQVPGVDAGIWRREADGSVTELLRVPAPSATTAPPAFSAAGASDDLSHILVLTQAKLLPEALAPPNFNLYEIGPDGLRLVSVRPDDTSVWARPGGTASPTQPDLLSRDGRTIVFQDWVAADNRIYARIDGTHTVDVSASQRATPDPAGTQSATYQGMAADGQRLYFTSAEALTDDARTSGGSATDLYEYDVESGDLRSITTGFDPGVAPDVLGITAITPDGSRVYYVARAALPNTGAVDGERNLYRYDVQSGGVRFVATLSSGHLDSNGNLVGSDQGLAQPGPRYGLAVPSEDGRRLLFESYGSLTGPESQSPDGTPRMAVYLYDDASGDLTCLSCGAPGSRANGDSSFTITGSKANAPLEEGPALGAMPNFSRGRVMTADGRRYFFTTRNALVPEDVNGRFDVYEWADGVPHLVSPGRAAHDALFEGSTPSGDDVVISTTESLTGSDTDVLSDLYDARVGGGFPDPPAPAAPCTGDACKGAPTRPAPAPVAASITFAGPPTVDVPRLTPPARVAKLTVAGRTIRGTAVTVKVKVNAAGRVSVSGARVVTVRKTVTRAGTYSLRVRLTSKARRSLKRHGRLKVGLRVGYVPKQGRASSKVFSVSLKG